MAVVATAALLLFAPAALGAQSSDGLPPSTTVVVPVVGSLSGLDDVRWVTSLELRNDTKTDVDVWLILPAAGDAPAYNLTLRGGQDVVMRDVMAEAFGAETALSPLKIVTSGLRSVTIHATVFGTRDGAVTAAQPIPIDYGPVPYGVVSLPGLSFSDAFRTNIGLVNLSESDSADFTLAVQRLAGRSIAVSHIRVPPVTLVHTPVQSLFPTITMGSDFTVVVECAQAGTYAYASVIQNGSSSARFVAPVVGFVGQDEETGP